MQSNFGGVCNYKQKSGLVAFLLSFFIGCLGADWFYLYVPGGPGGYIAGGFFKLITLGGLGIWALIDWIRVAAGAFSDSYGVALTPIA